MFVSAIAPNRLMHGGPTTESGGFLSTQCPLNTRELDEFFNTDSIRTIAGYQFISRFLTRLERELSKIG